VSLWCGTSVGAINAAAFASLADLPADPQAQQAVAPWEGLRKQDVTAPIVGRGGVRMLLRPLAIRSRWPASGSRVCSIPLRWRKP
jgi:NTE family protein